MFLPLLAADVGNYIGLAILVITVLGWIVNAIKGNDADGKPLPQRNKPKRDLRSELEVFLEELQQPQKPQEPAPQPERPIAPQKQQAQRQANPRQQSHKPRPPKAPKPQPTASKPAPKPQKSKNLAAKSGQSLRDHVSSFVSDNRVSAEDQQRMAHRVDQAVQQDLSGGTVAPVEPAEVRRTTPHPFLVMLARPEGMRQAILMNEILQRPKSLRSRKS